MKSTEKRFRGYVGKPVVTNDGKVIGTVVSIKLSRSDWKPISITVRLSDGSTREFNINDVNAVFATDKVVFQRFNDEYSGLVSMYRNEVDSIKERLRDIMDKLNKLSDLLLQGGIKEDLYRDIRDRLEKERVKWIRQCNEKISAINDTLSEIDKKIGNAERRKSELMIKQVVGDLGDDEKNELTGLDELLNQLRKVRSELLSLRMELEKECY
ncbi:PRC-barrel domain-containing protein [Vulcanisaeta sp. JCM 16161]|uniref:PRC-barrel domain-containing protein n=1 Tax=Vulcanisaeta sp. JCM 16161 TaxID=1295372 RepID=UPI001FB249CA|nr:PRC-barrel domain-containing protein [Vulcanisaeta sp. JCM 16161]